MSSPPPPPVFRAPPAPVAEAVTVDDPPLLTPALWTVLAAHLCFAFAWSIFLIQPKFLAAVLDAPPTVIGRAGATGGLIALLAIFGIVRGIDRLGRRPFFRLGTVVLAAAALGYLSVDRIGPLVYVLHGAVSASFVLAFNASASLFTDYATPKRMGQALGILGAANLSMNAVGTAVAEAIADAAGWDGVFMLAIAAATVALLVSLALPPGRHAGAGMPPGEVALPWRAVLPVLAVTALTGAGFCGLFMFHQPYALELGARRVGAFFVGFTIAGVGVRVLLGGLGDRHGRREVSMAMLVLYAAGIASAVVLQVNALWIHGLLFGAAHGVLYPTLNALAVERAPDEARGRVIALYNGSFNAGMALSALGWGAVAAEAGYRSVFWAAASAPLLGVVLLWRLGRERAAAESG